MEKIIINTIDNTKSEILIEENLSEKIEDFFEDKKYFLITNTTLEKLYPEFLSKFDKNRIIVIKDGEKYKNYKTVNYILDKLQKGKIERKDCIVALGGGVVGDLAGYCASVILRGVELIQVPTTLLAMCDSSIGGKTGYDTKYGKNLIGTFHFASKVITDPVFLKTLSTKQKCYGMAEIIKYSMIEKTCLKNSNCNLFDFIYKNNYKKIEANIKDVIHTCVAIKARVVSEDCHEGGFRKILNLGHTYGHAVEKLTNYKIPHGQAVGHGLKYASRLAYNMKKIDVDYLDKIHQLIERYGLINYKIRFKKQDMIEVMKKDKKVTDGKISLLVPVGIAQAELFDNIDLPSIEASVL